MHEIATFLRHINLKINHENNNNLCLTKILYREKNSIKGFSTDTIGFLLEMFILN